MYVIFLYGPPAVGKLTVAKELSLITGFPVFHNHLTRDLVLDVFPSTFLENYDLVTGLRSLVFDYCARKNQSLIFTWVYDGISDDETLSVMVEAIQSNGGRVLFVELTASEEILLERVENESRKAHKKLTDRETLRAILKLDSPSSVPYENVLKIDTSAQSPKQTAAIIGEHYHIQW